MPIFPSVRVILAEGDAFVRDLISHALTKSGRRYHVVAAVGTADAAVGMCRRHKPDLVVLAAHLPDQTGIAAVREIRLASPGTKILLCSAVPSEGGFMAAGNCGVEGFVEKTTTWEDFLSAIDRVSRGQRYFCSGGAIAEGPVVDDKSKALTAREREVLKLIATGMTSRQIATRLLISPATVETHRSNLMSKTGARNVARLVRFAIESGMAAA